MPIGREKNEAQEAYLQTTEALHLRENHLHLWAFDIALDCIRTLPAQEQARLLAAKAPDLLHFDYGMYIRNRYLYPSHRHGKAWHADDLSRMVMQVIFAVLNARHTRD